MINILVLKLDSGYNIGIDVGGALAELVKKGDKPNLELPPLDIGKDSINQIYQ